MGFSIKLVQALCLSPSAGLRMDIDGFSAHCHRDARLGNRISSTFVHWSKDCQRIPKELVLFLSSFSPLHPNKNLDFSLNGATPPPPSSLLPPSIPPPPPHLFSRTHNE